MNLEQIVDMFRGMLVFPGRPSSDENKCAILFLEELKKKRARLLELIQILDDSDCTSHGLDWVIQEMREILGQ